jgi:4-amino-4-deoxy-L-arabinose transferase-like glycosyltransferase
METSLSTYKSAKQDSRLRVDLELGLLLVLVGVVFFVRITNILYNTLFVDEAIYVTGGRDLLAGLTDRHIITWFGGSYFYPFISAMAANLAGVAGIRLVSALLTTITAVFVYLTARRLFDRPAALWAILIFGLAGGSISIGQLAVYDTLTLPFLAAAFYCVISATQSKHSAWKYLLIGSLAFSAATLAKYTAIFYLPALVLTACALYALQHRLRHVFQLIIFFLMPAGMILGAYTLYFFSDLLKVFTEQGFEAAPRWMVLQSVWDEIGWPLLAALGGMVLTIGSAWRGSTPDDVAVVRVLRDYLQPRRKLALMLVIAGAAVLFAAYLSLPLYQLLTSNIRSVWKNTIASLIFLTPFAGYLMARAIDQIRHLRTARLVSALLITGLVMAWTGYSLDRNWGLQHSWPNVSGAVDYMREHGLSKDSHVLAEAGAVYEYYFYSDLGIAGRKVWSDTWSMTYQGQQGVDAMIAAISDHWLDYVVLDDNYTPALNPRLDTALLRAGYTIGYQDLQRITTGHDSVVRVYARSSQ